MDPQSSVPSPSTRDESDRYVAFKEEIYDGRYFSTAPCETRGPPIQLYHPVFGYFLDDIATQNVPEFLVRSTARLMSQASGIYQNKGMWKSAIHPALNDILRVVDKENSPGEAHSMIGSEPVMDEIACIAIVEDRNEFADSEGGSNPSNGAVLSYARAWAQLKRSKIRENSCCPSFLIAIDAANASIAIMGAVWRERIIVQHLTDSLRLAHNAIFNEDTIYRNARILYALFKSMHMLNAYYKSLGVEDQVHSLPADRLAPRFFPSINAYPGTDNTIISFRYIAPFKPNSVCTSFMAKTEGSDSRFIIVKFVCRYNEEAHRLLASKRMAPKLHYCGKIGFRPYDPSYGRLRMVVMDFVKGKTVDQGVTLPPAFPQRIEGMLSVLHGADYVFGDLRGSNIMITENCEVMFLDYGMAGKHADSLYPIMMPPHTKWPRGVGGGLYPMLKEHDLVMSERLMVSQKLIPSMIVHV